MAEPDNLVLGMLRAMRGDMAKTADALRSAGVGIRRHLAGVLTIQDRDREDVAATTGRLELAD